MKKTILSCVAAVGITLGSLGMISAQDAAQAPNAQSPAVYFSERGDELATIRVTSITDNWDGHSQYTQPNPGNRFVLVNFEVTVTGKKPVAVVPYDFSLVDTHGFNLARSYVSLEDGDTTPLLQDETSVPSGKTQQFSLPFQMSEEMKPALFMWQPDNGVLVSIPMDGVLEGEPGQAGPSTGESTPATSDAAATPASGDEGAATPVAAQPSGEATTVKNADGEEIASISVDEVDPAWTGYAADYQAPEGKDIVLVTLTVTNTSKDPISIARHDADLVTGSGENVLSRTVTAKDASVNMLASRVTIEPGDSETFSIAYPVTKGETPDHLELTVEDTDVTLPLNQ